MQDQRHTRFTPEKQEPPSGAQPGAASASSAQAAALAPQPNSQLSMMGAAHEPLDLLDVFGTLWRGKFVLAACFVLAVIAGVFYLREVAQPLYTATTSLVFKRDDTQVVDIQSVVGGGRNDFTTLNTEIQVLSTRELAAEVVERLNLAEHPVFNPSLRPPEATWRTSLRERYNGIVEGFAPSMVIMLPEPPTIDQVRRGAVGAVASMVSVNVLRNTHVLMISATTPDRALSRDIADALADAYLEDQMNVKLKAFDFAVNFLSSRVAELEVEVFEQEEALKTLRNNTSLISPEALAALSIRAKDMRERLDAREAEAARLASETQQASLMLEALDYTGLASIFGDATLSRLLSDVEVDNARARQQFEARAATLLRAEQQALTRQESQVAALKNSYDTLQEELEAQGADLARINQLLREFEATQVLYQTFLARLKETSVQIGLEQPDSRVLSRAVLGRKVAPQSTMILAISAFLGLVFGAAVLFYRQYVQNGFRTADDLTALTGLPVIGQIPKIPLRRRKGLIPYLLSKPSSAAAEAIRNLRTSIVMANIERPPQVIMSTSSIPGEGKTTQALALAQNFAGLGKKVLLVDCDVRRRTLDEYFERRNVPGDLGDVIENAIPLEEATFTDERLRIDVLLGSVAKKNAADVFSSQEFSRTIREMRAQYDVVILDTPPVMAVSDARIVGRHCDAIIYTVRWDKTSQTVVRSGVQQFASVGISITGFVLSQIDGKTMRKYGYGNEAYGSASYGYYDN